MVDRIPRWIDEWMGEWVDGWMGTFTSASGPGDMALRPPMGRKLKLRDSS